MTEVTLAAVAYAVYKKLSEITRKILNQMLQSTTTFENTVVVNTYRDLLDCELSRVRARSGLFVKDTASLCFSLMYFWVPL